MLQQPTLERDRGQTFRDNSERRPFDVSKALLHGCDQKTVRDSIFALRRGPVRYSRGAMIACEGDAPDYIYVVSRSAECRVTTFLIDLSMRTGNSKYLDLPMSHQDIADYLGLTIETLSRTITTLEKSGSIARASCRTLVLRNRSLLMQTSD